MSKNVVTLKSGSEVTQGHRNDTIRSGTHDFLITFHDNHRLIFHRFRDKRRFKSKIFPPSRLFCAPVDGVPLGIGYRCRGQKKRNDGATRRSRKF